MKNEPTKKNIVQDVVPGRRSIRNIELPNRRKSNTLGRDHRLERKDPEEEFTRPVSIKKEIIKENEKIEDANDAYSYEYEDDTPKSSKKLLYVSATIAILVIAFGVSALFKKAVITITPQSKVVSLDASFKAQKDSTGGTLGFQVVSVTKELQKDVEASGEENVSIKSKGVITIFNNTSQSQKLVATTRFETPEGLIYRIPNAVTVPARTVKDGKTIPGSIDSTVEADGPGDKYNIGLKDFKIPGFKGDAKYDQIYGRSKSEMTGGFQGVRKVVSEEVLSGANVQLENDLKSSLSSEIKSQIPNNFVLYDSGVSYEFSATSQSETTENNASIKKRGTAYAFIFDKTALTREIVENLMPESAEDNIRISNLNALDFSFMGSIAEAEKNSVLDFKLVGQPEFVWVFDENSLLLELSGLGKVDAKQAISKYPSIKEAYIKTYPFWNGSVPKNVDKIQIINTLDK
ncbi:MAG: hypothetical protein WC095_01640 [Candidatus Paceibacterota bacterium]